MCWSGEASAAVAVLGFSTAAYAFYRKEPAPIYLALAYFSLMEALQAFTYTVIDKCALPSNQIATLLGYLHISFQPFFVNAVSLFFIPAAMRKKIELPVYTLCFFGMIVTLIQIFPFEWAGQCRIGRILCAERLCSVHGNWHIAWQMPLNGIGNYFYDHHLFPFHSGFPAYGFVAFGLPLLYGSWRFTAFHFLLGPTLSKVLSGNVQEQPAIWCLLSFGLLLLAVETPLRRHMHTKGVWFLRDKPCQTG